MSKSTIAKRLAQVEPGTLYAGVDLGLKENMVVLIDQYTQQQQTKFKFPQDADGYRYFMQKLEAVRTKVNAPAISISMEPTNYFWKLLATYLEQKGRSYHLVNAYTVKKRREGDQLDRSKDDPRDAFMIADLDRTGKYTETQLQHGIYEELRQYGTLYKQLSKNIRKEKTILTGLAGQVFPEICQIFKSLNGMTFRAILCTCPAAATIRTLSEEEFIQRVRAAFTGQRLYTTKLHRAYQLAAGSIGLTEGLQANQLAIQMHIELLEQLEKQVLDVIDVMKNCLCELDVVPYLLSMRCFNTLSVALLLGEIGDPNYYHSGSQLIKLAGTQPVPNTSGRKQRSQTPMSHLGRAGLRTILFFACLRMIRCDRHFKKRYQELLSRKKNPLTKMQAIGVLMNKILLISWALMRDKKLYDPNHHLMV